jgi:putative ABC transport system substrate-binding protein
VRTPAWLHTEAIPEMLAPHDARRRYRELLGEATGAAMPAVGGEVVPISASRERSTMRRREFMVLVSGVAAWPLRVDAQVPNRMRSVGILMPFTQIDAEGQTWLNALFDGLRALGWIEGANVKFHVRWAEGDAALMGSLAKELVALRPDLIFANSSPVLAAVKQATSTTPIVFINVSNPVGAGFVQSLARPGGNATGLANYEGEIASKWLAQVKEIAPAVTKVAVLLHPDAVAHGHYWRALAAAAPSLGITPVAAPFRTAADIENALNGFAGQTNTGLVVLANIITTVNRGLIIRLAAKHQMPAVYPFRVFVSDGGLMSYGSDLVEGHRHVARFVDSILKGASPTELPVQLQTKFAIAINLKTAKTLGLTVPPTLLALADEVIE